jgi:hypothetical protein
LTEGVGQENPSSLVVKDLTLDSRAFADGTHICVRIKVVDKTNAVFVYAEVPSKRSVGPAIRVGTLHSGFAFVRCSTFRANIHVSFSFL